MSQNVDAAIALMLTEYGGLQVHKLTVAAYRARLAEFPAGVAVQALRLLPLVVRGRAPNTGDVWAVADTISRKGYAACALAARRWPQWLGDAEAGRTAPSPRQWDDSVSVAFRTTGNPDTAGHLSEHQEPEAPPDREFAARIERRMHEQGCTRQEAIFAIVRDVVEHVGGACEMPVNEKAS